MSSAIQALCRAVTHNTSYDAFAPALTAQQWELLGEYMQGFDLPAGHVLISQGAMDRTLFFIEGGTLSVLSPKTTSISVSRGVQGRSGGSPGTDISNVRALMPGFSRLAAKLMSSGGCT